MKCHRQDGGFLCQGLPAIDHAMGYAIDHATCSTRD